MDIKKTDIFSGIGVFIIQIIVNIICYACKRKIASTLTFLGGCFAATDI